MVKRTIKIFLMVSILTVSMTATLFSQETPNDMINLYNQGKLAEAEDMGIKLLSTYPENLQIYIYLVFSLYRQGKAQKCLQYTKEALSIFPSDPELLKMMGRLYIDAGGNDVAVQFIEKALQINPQDPWGYYYYGKALFNMGKYYAGAVAFEASIKLLDDQYFFYYYLAYCYAKYGDIKKALDLLENSNKRFNNPKLVELYQQIKNGAF